MRCSAMAAKHPSSRTIICGSTLKDFGETPREARGGRPSRPRSTPSSSARKIHRARWVGEILLGKLMNIGLAVVMGPLAAGLVFLAFGAPQGTGLRDNRTITAVVARLER